MMDKAFCGGAVHDRDINAAVNIRHQSILQLKAEGLSVSACGGRCKTGTRPAAANEARSSGLLRSAVTVCLFSATVAVAMMGSSMPGEAAPPVPCKEIVWTPGTVWEIKAKPHHRTRIELPEPIQGAPVPGNARLWDVTAEHTFVFITPRILETDEGAETTVSLVTVQGKPFDFLVRRTRGTPDLCLKILPPPSNLVSGAIQGWGYPQDRYNRDLEARLKDTQALLLVAQQDKDTAVLDALALYRTQIYTRYTWEGGSEFFGEDTVTDVYDDGRFTLVRFRTDNKGVLQVTAVIEDQEEFIEHNYDSDKRLLIIAGIFPHLLLRYDDAEITIERTDAKTAGAY